MNNSKYLLIFFGVVVAGVAAAVFFGAKKPIVAVVPPAPVACTMEAKLCPDGSYVSRTGPDCAFAECPTADPSSPSYVTGHITIGPFCPVERAGQPCPVPPSAYSSRQVVVYQTDMITVKEKDPIDANGNYKIALPPGTYYIQIQPAGVGLGQKKPVVVTPGSTNVVNFDIDTGIR